MAVRYFGTVKLWHYCTMALWHYGTIARWHYGTIALWNYGTLALWNYGTFASWHYGTMAPWHWHYGTMTPWCYGTMARWHFCAQSLATALPSRGQIMIEFLDTYAVNDEIPVLGGHQPPLKTSADTEVRRFYHVFACCRATIFEKTSILPVPSQNHGLDGKGVSHHHDTVRLIVIVMKGVGVGVKYRSDTIVATCQDK